MSTLFLISFFLCFFFLAALEFELGAYTLSHSTSSFCDVFSRKRLVNYLPGLALNSLPPE
jgi:hypothetical protein